MQYLIGIDAGTTNQKAILFNEQGTVICQAIRPSPLTAFPDGTAVYEADAVWGQICAILREITAQAGKEVLPHIAGVAVTGMAEAGVPLSGKGDALYPFIAWYDPRTIPYAGWWKERFSPERITEITGLKVQHIFSVNKLMWLRDQEPAIFQRMNRWACMEDYIAWKLTGVLKMDYSIGSRTMMMDLQKKVWSRQIMEAAGLNPDLMPELVPSGTKVGSVTAEAAHCTGLLEGTPVFAGGHDHVCGALACGILRKDAVLDSSGTAEEILAASSDPVQVGKLGMEGYNVGHHVASGLYYMAGGIPASGASVDWFSRQFPSGDREALKKPGANGLLFLPHLRGSSSPTRNPASSGAFLGIRHYHTHADFSQAVYEGLCYEFRLALQQLTQGQQPEKIVAIGGGTKNRHWIQVKANVTGLPIEIPAIQESTALGAALLAGIGAGMYASAEDAAARVYRVGETVLPNLAFQMEYDRQFAVFSDLYDVLLPLNERLNCKT